MDDPEDVDIPEDVDSSEHMEMDTLPKSTTASNLECMPSHNILAFGLAAELDDLSLPTAGDILRQYFFLGDRCKGTNKMFSLSTFTPNVCDKLIHIWDELHIEVASKKNIITKLGKLLKSYQEVTRAQTKKPDEFREFVDSTKIIFYI